MLPQADISAEARGGLGRQPFAIAEITLPIGHQAMHGGYQLVAVDLGPILRRAHRLPSSPRAHFQGIGHQVAHVGIVADLCSPPRSDLAEESRPAEPANNASMEASVQPLEGTSRGRSCCGSE